MGFVGLLVVWLEGDVCFRVWVCVVLVWGFVGLV